MVLAKNVLTYTFDKEAISSLPELLKSRKRANQDYTLFIVDHYFESSKKFEYLKEGKDFLYYLNTVHEPTTDLIDEVRDSVLTYSSNLPVSVVGIGGGSALDTAKAVSNLLTNGGKAEDYQGWDLVKVPGVYKIGVPTLSGTGAEASRTCVMMNEKKNLKLGMNSGFTIFDHLILDPALTETVPSDQYFYSGMDTYIHCIESLNGNHRHALADAYSREALNLCKEIYLTSKDMKSELNREKIMAASYLGGAALANSFVGIIHPFSAGLSMVFHTHHCISNCIVMNQMEEFYPEGYKEFQAMLTAQNINLPKGICANLTDEQYEKLYLSTIIHEKPLKNALGEDFKKILTREKVIEIFKKM